MPLLWSLSGKFQFSNKACYTSQLILGKQWNMVSKWETPLVDGCKLTYHAKTDFQKMLMDPKNMTLKTGLAVELKL